MEECNHLNISDEIKSVEQSVREKKERVKSKMAKRLNIVVSFYLSLQTSGGFLTDQTRR